MDHRHPSPSHRESPLLRTHHHPIIALFHYWTIHMDQTLNLARILMGNYSSFLQMSSATWHKLNTVLASLASYPHKLTGVPLQYRPLIRPWTARAATVLLPFPPKIPLEIPSLWRHAKSLASPHSRLRFHPYLTLMQHPPRTHPTCYKHPPRQSTPSSSRSSLPPLTCRHH